MLLKVILPLLALTGIAWAAMEAGRNGKSAPPVPPAAALPESPYPSYVAGAGLVEASTENISIGSQSGGIVTRIFVRLGDTVKSGDPLFELDGRAVRGELASRRAALQVSQVAADNAQYDLDVANKLAAHGVNAANDLEEKRYAAKKAQAQRMQAEADLKASEISLELLTVRAPVDGQILQLKIHLGEFVPEAASTAGQPLILLGNVTPLHLRAEVNETDAWRVPAQASAIGFLRGNPQLKVGLKFVRFEPYVVPKVSLTGSSTERVDTRVLQVIFSFDRADLPIFVGQQMDVFIESPGNVIARE